MTSPRTLLHSRTLPKGQSGTHAGTHPSARRLGVRRLRGAADRGRRAPGAAAPAATRSAWCSLGGLASTAWSHDKRAGRASLGPRRDVFSGYPHALYLPPRTTFEIRAKRTTEIAECRSPTARRFAPRVIRPADCGLEVRGGGNATRQIIDILPPAAEADRLLVCEVLTPAGNWSSYPPHKHDRHNPPVEADLEETYYYRFSEPGGYGIQRLYTSRIVRSRCCG